MSYLVTNPEDGFSHDKAHFILYAAQVIVPCRFELVDLALQIS